MAKWALLLNITTAVRNLGNPHPSLMGHSARIALTHYARATLAERADAMRLVPTPTYEEELSD